MALVKHASRKLLSKLQDCLIPSFSGKGIVDAVRIDRPVHRGLQIVRYDTVWFSASHSNQYSRSRCFLSEFLLPDYGGEKLPASQVEISNGRVHSVIIGKDLLEMFAEVQVNVVKNSAQSPTPKSLSWLTNSI